MKRLIYFFILAALVTACNTDIEIDPVEFDVTVKDAANLKAGVPVVFEFTGQADLLSVYTGGIQREYQFKDGRVVDVSTGGAYIQFTSGVSGGSQANQLSVLYSTNFSGDYSDLSKVKAATWTDITSSIKLGTSATQLASGTFDISDMVAGGKPIYFAFKYLTMPQGVNGAARSWVIQNFLVKSKVQLGTTDISAVNQAMAGFRIVDENKANAPARSSITPTQISMLGNTYLLPTDTTYIPGSPWNDPQSENWAISKAIVLDKVDLGPDRPIAFKSTEVAMTKSISVTYAAAGTYNVCFVASNNSINNSVEVVKCIEITIQP